jgi:hypothetical protein
MRTLRALALIPVAGLLLAACGDSTSSDTTTPASAPVTTAPVSTVVSSSVADTTPATAVDGPVQIDVKVGTDSGPDRVEKVKLGSDVTLNITNADAADEYHVHTIDLEQKVDKGVTATFNFVADTPGTYEVESHLTETVLLVIEVA